MKYNLKHRPLRFTLTVSITALIISVSLSILAISYYVSESSLLVLSENMTVEISKGIIEKLSAVLSSAEKTNAVVNRMIAQETFDPIDGQRTMDASAALLSQNESFSSVEIALPDGSKYQAQRAADGSIIRRSDIRTSTNVIQKFYYENPDFPNQEKENVKSLEQGYDARARPWFINAVSAGKTTWTEMYVSGKSKVLAISCVTPVYNKNHDLLAVAAIDINLVTLSQFLGTIKILDHGKAFIVNDRDQVIAIPIKSQEKELDRLFKRNPEGSEQPYRLHDLEELPDQDIRMALLSYRRNERRCFEVAGKDGEPNVVSLVKYPYKGGSAFRIGIIFPKSDIMGSISKNTRFMLVGVLLFLLVAILIGLSFSRKISSSLAVLCEEVNKVSRLELDSNRIVESHILEVARIDESVQNMKRELRSFKKYVPVDLVLQLNALQKEAALEGEKREVSIFFSDIADFTSISERLTPEELVVELGVYFSGMSRFVLDHAGTLDKYIGDAIMAFWGAPLPRENHASLACATALACQQYLDRLELEAESHPILRTRIGIHTGEVIVGNIGSEERLNYTIIGDPVNLANRLEGLNKYYHTRIIISEDTFSRVKDEFVARKLDRVTVKGKTQGILIYELIAARDDINSAQQSFVQASDRAIELYMNQSWAESRQAFMEAQKLSPQGKDYLCELFDVRCEEFMRAPPGPDWNGVYMHKSK